MDSLVVISGCLLLVFLVSAGAESFDVRGPPIADEKEVKLVAQIGQTVRLVCPMSGYPTPMFEWTLNGEKIDPDTWERHRTSKKYLKIKNVNMDDTGIFVCKGVNGFGSDQAKVQLLVIDPLSMKDGVTPDMAPPVFTYDTHVATSRQYVKNVGETFQVFCETMGNPQPKISWFKDGQRIVESVHEQRGRSTVEFSVMGTADAGVYTCRASNPAGIQAVNFTLEVKETVTHAIVTESGPANTTVEVSETATLQCRVKALSPPHIKWLKRVDLTDSDEEDTLRVGEERYRILGTNKEEKTGKDEYLSRLVLARVSLADSGMYICFVTNSGFGALTYNSMNLRVVEKSIIEKAPDMTPESEPFSILVLVICLSIIVFILLMVITVCVIRKRTKNASVSSPDSPDIQRPFMSAASQNNNKFSHPLPMPPITIGGHWGHSVYPEYQQQHHKMGTDSGFDASMCMDSPKELDASLNQYEVPYSHLLSAGAAPRTTDRLLPYAFRAEHQLGRPHPAGQSSVSGVSETLHHQQQQHLHNLYPFRNYGRQQQYLSDYESQ